MLSPTATLWAAAAGAAAVAVGAALYVWQPGFLFPAPIPASVSERAPAAAVAGPRNAEAVAPATKAASPTASAAPPADRPAFDVVNVEPTGEAVVAGRAAPNAKVVLRDAGKKLAEAPADSAGQFVIIPSPLAPGDHSLTLATGAGEAPADMSNAIAVAVPEPPPKAVAAASAPSIGAATPAPAPAAPSSKIAVRSVEASAGGGMVAKGAASPNATVRLYLSGAFVGDAKTTADGRWSLTIEHGMTPGAYAVRADEINPANASVVARAEAPFEFPATPQATSAPTNVVASTDDRPATPVASPADVVVASVQTHHVERGHTLWGISQKYYGDGTRYQLIFAANANQIRDPHWIYPGQMFVVPKPQQKP